MKKAEVMKDGDAVCSICEDSAPQHRHYGAICCHSCMVFFRRGQGKEFPRCLLGENNCEINKFTRTNCKQCRYDRCIQVGMRPEKVDLTVKRKNQRIKAESGLKKQLSECKETGGSNVQKKPILTEDEIKNKEETVIVTDKERKQNMLRENQKRILMYNQKNGIKHYSKITAKVQKRTLKSSNETNEDHPSPQSTSSPHPTPPPHGTPAPNLIPYPKSYPSTHLTSPNQATITPQMTPSLYSTLPPHPISPYHPTLSPLTTPSPHLTPTPLPISPYLPILLPHITPSPHLTPLLHPSPSYHPTLSPQKTSPKSTLSLYTSPTYHPTLPTHPIPPHKPTLSPQTTLYPLPIPPLHPSPQNHPALSPQMTPSPHSTLPLHLSPTHHTTHSLRSTPSPQLTLTPYPSPPPHQTPSPHQTSYSHTMPSHHSTPSPQLTHSPSPTQPCHLTPPLHPIPSPKMTPSPHSTPHHHPISLLQSTPSLNPTLHPHPNPPHHPIPSSQPTCLYSNPTPLYLIQKAYLSNQTSFFDNTTTIYPITNAYSRKYPPPSYIETLDITSQEIEDEEDGFNFCPEEKTWVPIKKRPRMTNYDVFPEKRHLDWRIVPIMAFTFEETNNIGQMLQAHANWINKESKYAMRVINPELILEQEVGRVEAVAKGAKILVNEDYLQFRMKLCKETFKQEGCMFFDRFVKLPRYVRDIMFEATIPSTILLWFAYLHARRGAESLAKQETRLLCSAEVEKYRVKNIPDIVNSRSIQLEDFELMTSPWAVNEEDEIKFEKTIKTVGDILGVDSNMSVLYFHMLVSNPHPGSILCRNIQDHPALLSLQTEINELMYRYLKSQPGYTEELASASVRYLRHLVLKLHECAHIFWKKRLKISLDKQESSDICIDELYDHVWDKQIHTLED